LRRPLAADFPIRHSKSTTYGPTSGSFGFSLTVSFFLCQTGFYGTKRLLVRFAQRKMLSKSERSRRPRWSEFLGRIFTNM
jgi:hypothetical protein